MRIFPFYRLAIAICVGVAAAFSLVHTWWFALLVTIAVRLIWAVIDHILERCRIDRLFRKHEYAFKQQFGPYGIRIINKAYGDRAFKKSVAEVFTDDETKLLKTVETLELMDTLFRAGLRPEGDEYQLHDLKLKYGRMRLDEFRKSKGG